MKRSAHISLVLVGAVSLTACGNGDKQMRNYYANKSDCIADYSEQQCASASRDHYYGGYYGGYGGGRGFYGPSYTSDGRAGSDPGPGRAGLATRKEAVARGGFGASSSRYARAGS